MKAASIKEVQTHVKRVFLDECHNALSYVRQRALLSGPAYLLWNGIGSVFSSIWFGLFWSLCRGVKQLAEGRRRCGYSHQRASWKTLGSVLPTECAEDEVHDKEGAEEDEGAEVDPRPRRPARVLHLTTGQKAQGRKTKTNKNKKLKKENGARGSKKG